MLPIRTHALGNSLRFCVKSAPGKGACRMSSQAAAPCGCCGLPGMLCKTKKVVRNQYNNTRSWSNSAPRTSKHSVLLAEHDDSASPHLKDILGNNRAWVKGMNESDPQYFNNLAKPQAPKFLYFGCSDSRVPANTILGLQ